MIRNFTAVVTFLICATQGASQTFFGHSNTDCIEFLKYNETTGVDTFVSNWIDGYFSGRIRETGRDLKIVNDLDIPLYGLLLKTCKTDPTLNLHEAADIVYVSIP